MATIVEFAQRMLTKRPTVALTSETAIWLFASSPTRAREPRTEITRPKDVTVRGLSSNAHSAHRTMVSVAGETVKAAWSRLGKIRDILVGIGPDGSIHRLCCWILLKKPVFWSRSLTGTAV